MTYSNSSESGKEIPPPSKKCPESSEEPISYANGNIVFSASDVSWRGLGFEWGHTRSYANITEGGTQPSEHGFNWFLSDMPFLFFGQEPGTGTATVSVIYGTFTSLWFKSDGSGGWIPRFGGYESLTHNTAAREYVVTSQDGGRVIFHDDDGGLSQSMRGRLKGIESAGGARAVVTYDLDDELESVVWSDADGNEAKFAYSYYDDLEKLGLVESVNLSVNGKAVERGFYNYYGLNDDHGPLRTLRNAVVEEPDGSGGWRTIREQWFRYYKSDDGNGGVKYGIKLMLESDGVAAARAAGVVLESAPDTSLEPYASHQFVYDSDRRVTSEDVRGGEAAYGFAWLPNNADPGFADVNTWYRRSVETLPDNSERRVYTNRGGFPILSIVKDTAPGGGEWYDYYEYNSDYRVIEHASSEAVQSVSEPADGNGTLTVTLKTDAGLIEVSTYWPADDLPNGEVEGYLETTGVKEGDNGTVDILRKYRYDTQTVGNVSIHPVQEILEFLAAGVPESQASKTTFARTWHTDELSAETFQVDKLATTFPVVSTADHGTGLEEKTEHIFDIGGFLTWEKDARGVITRRFYDEILGAETQRIDDANPSLLTDPPQGWTAPTFGGEHLVTDYMVDDRGRTVREIGPEHTALIDGAAVEPCQPSNVSAELVRTVSYSLYLDSRHQTWMAQGYVTEEGTAAESWQILGPVSIERRDTQERTTDTIQARASCPCGDLSTGSFAELDSDTELPDRSLWTRWSHMERDLWGRETVQRDYFDIPLDGNGFKDFNFLETSYSYDSVNRQNRVISPDNTIARTVFDVRNLRTSTWVGTDDTGATDSNPGNDGLDGNNMAAVLILKYDDEQSGGNGNPTEERLPVDSNATNDRVTNFSYDFRNRQIRIEANDGTRPFITDISYDNLNNPEDRTIFHTSPVNANRIAKEEALYDSRGRVFEQKTWGIDFQTGNLTNALIKGTWRDPNNNVIKRTEAGTGKTIKTDYDSVNRESAIYLVVPGTPPAGAPANDVSDDIVVSQREFAYDRGSKLIELTDLQRLNDATGKGPLGTPNETEPKARPYFYANYSDPIGRIRFEANFGTNGGVSLNRPETPPSPSETVLVTENRFQSDGQPSMEIQTNGTVVAPIFDSLGRTTKLIEALGSEAERSTSFRWGASGNITKLISTNPDTGEQVTSWEYGSDPSDGIARNDLLVQKNWPDGDFQKFTYNRQGNLTSSSDSNGTTHTYIYNDFGNLLHDCVPTIGVDLNAGIRRISFTYNDLGKIDTISSWDDASPGSGAVANQVGFDYDAFLQIISDEQEHSGAVGPQTPTVTYNYTNGSNNVFRQTAFTSPSGSQVDITYGSPSSIDDVFNRVTSLKVTGESNNLVDYSYAGDQIVTKIYLPGPDAELSYLKDASRSGEGDAGDDMTGYDRFGRTTRMPWRLVTDDTVIADIEYGYDRGSWRKWRRDLTAAAQEKQDRFNGYDALGQVIESALGTLNENRTAIGGVPEESESWHYDETGNWKRYEKELNGATDIDQTRGHDQSNRITKINGSNAGVDYDKNGNMRRISSEQDLEGPARLLVWDAWDRLVEVRELETSSLIARFAYDGMFRRIEREDAQGDVVHTYFNLNWRPVEERLNASNDPQTIYYWGDRHRDDLVRRDRDTLQNSSLDETLYCLMDYYNPIAIINDSGEIQERYSYSPFGIASILSPDFNERSSSSFDWRFLFQGQFYDENTGFQNFGFRYYFPELGRFLNRDPISEDGGLNVYGFCENNPVNSVDHFGLRKTRNCKTKSFTINFIIKHISIGRIEAPESKVGVGLTVVDFGVWAFGGFSGIECEECCDDGQWKKFTAGVFAVGLRGFAWLTAGPTAWVEKEKDIFLRAYFGGRQVLEGEGSGSRWAKLDGCDSPSSVTFQIRGEMRGTLSFGGNVIGRWKRWVITLLEAILAVQIKFGCDFTFTATSSGMTYDGYSCDDQITASGYWQVCFLGFCLRDDF